MCRMIAYASEEPLDVAPYLASLADLSRCGNLLERWERRPGGNHPDGWGMAYRHGDETRIVRSGKPAGADPLLPDVRVRTDRFIGHVRYASNTATVNAGNAHPFLAPGLALAHNGTFKGKIGEEADGRNVSDTLVFLERLTDLWRERTLPRLSEVLTQMLCDRTLVGGYSAANLLILSGGSLFVLRNYRKDEDYYTLYLRAMPGQAVVASEPIDDSSDWRPLGNGELLELRPGVPQSVFLTATV
ncbi:MAG: class II glutamine amidotransferase [Deltaproteobacteria bacterium]|nr:class II glutamine amidotransferase [Deltaproteobacteria bacterium]